MLQANLLRSNVNYCLKNDYILHVLSSELSIEFNKLHYDNNIILILIQQ